MVQGLARYDFRHENRNAAEVTSVLLEHTPSNKDTSGTLSIGLSRHSATTVRNEQSLLLRGPQFSPLGIPSSSYCGKAGNISCDKFVWT